MIAEVVGGRGRHAHGRKRRCGCGVVKSSLRSWSSVLAAKPANKKFSVRARPLKTSRLRIWVFVGKMFSLFSLLCFSFLVSLPVNARRVYYECI